MTRAFAAEGAPLGRIGGEGLGPFGNIELTAESGLKGITDAVSSVIGFMTVAGSIWFLFNILYGGYEWISAGGDAKKIASARDHITHAFIGLVIVVGAWSLLALAGQFLGFDTLANPGAIMDSLRLDGSGGSGSSGGGSPGSGNRFRIFPD